jgi:hypothetical protein
VRGGQVVEEGLEVGAGLGLDRPPVAIVVLGLRQAAGRAVRAERRDGVVALGRADPDLSQATSPRLSP